MSSLQLSTEHSYVSPTPTQMTEANDFIARWAKAWSAPDPDAELFRGLMQADTQNLIPPMEVPVDRAGVIEHFKQVLQRLPSLKLHIVRWAPTGDTVIIEWRGNATVNGKDLDWFGTDRISLRDGRTYAAQAYWDTRLVTEKIMDAMQS